jgi:hypothetical protein
MVILFSRDSSDFLFISQYIFLTFSSNCLFSAFICDRHVSYLSRWSPRYLTPCLIGMGKLLILTCGQIVLLVVNVICVDFAGLTVIFHCSIQFWSRLRCCCNYWEAVLNWTSELYRPSDRRLSAKLVANLRKEGATWSAWQIPMAVFSAL